MSEPSYERATRLAYDTVAVDYERLLRDELESKAVDRAQLAAFAELVIADGSGPVADLGCGPGRVTAHLHALGVQVFGIDLSPGMIAVARTEHPGLRFVEGTMVALDLEEESLAGIVAWYSIIHTPPERLPVLFVELHRVLRPGGHVLLAFQVGDERVHLHQAYGHALSLDVHRLAPDRVADQLEQAGLHVTARLIRPPEPPERTEQAYLVATKPTPGAGPPQRTRR